MQGAQGHCSNSNQVSQENWQQQKL